MSTNIRSRCFVFTLNHYTEEDIKNFDELKYSYLIYGKEKGARKEVPHLQGYIEFDEPTAFKTLKKFNERIHWEPRKGSQRQAIDYCKKDGDFHEFGEMKKQGTRNDINELRDLIVSGEVSYADILYGQYFGLYCRYRSGFRDLFARKSKDDSKYRDVEVILLTGYTGSGKTHYALNNPEDQGKKVYKIQAGKLDFFEGYDGEEILLIDEYSNNVSITDLLSLLDNHKLTLNVKGSSCSAFYTKVYITTNLSLDQIHPDAKPEHRQALQRRINKVIYFDKITTNLDDNDQRMSFEEGLMSKQVIFEKKIENVNHEDSPRERLKNSLKKNKKKKNRRRSSSLGSVRSNITLCVFDGVEKEQMENPYLESEGSYTESDSSNESLYDTCMA